MKKFSPYEIVFYNYLLFPPPSLKKQKPSSLHTSKNITYDRYSFYIIDSRCITVLLYTAILYISCIIYEFLYSILITI
ncbi:hypothetical protein CLOM621_08073 [Clostridium sp. M62/1]|nr:hypothetical protein CLOM621_08073 [Clostridium sp. M62/1]